MAGMELISIPAECYTWVKGDEAMHNTCDAQAGNCSTLVFGKAASETGHVMIAHNEDDSNCVVQMLRVPRKRHNAAEVLRFPDGSAEIPQVSETNAYYWSEIRAPHGASFGDSFINEHGVAVFSNRAMPCKLPRVSEKNGLGYGLRKIVAERATSARDGMRILADLVEAYGYISARIYLIADKDECWICQVTTGHRLAARKLADEEVYFSANWYTLHHIDFDDPEHYYYSPDLVTFAIDNGWYVPAQNGCYDDFDFAAAYFDPGIERQLYNEYRTRSAWPLLGFERREERPFSYKAARKYGLSDAKALLRDHGECAGFSNHDHFDRNPHQNDPLPCTVCNGMTVDSMIVEFSEISALTVIWRTQLAPCISPYVPIYLGALDVPENYHFHDAEISKQTHFSPSESEFRYNPHYAYWAFKTLQWMTELDYGFCHVILEKEIPEMESNWQAEQDEVRQTFLHFHDTDRAVQYLTAYTKQCETDVWLWVLEMVQKIGEKKYSENISTSLECVSGGATFRADYTL